MRLRINGRAIIGATSPRPTIKKTAPKEIAIRIYRIVQTGPKTQLGGAHFGFFNVLYQLYAFFMSAIDNPLPDDDDEARGGEELAREAGGVVSVEREEIHIGTRVAIRSERDKNNCDWYRPYSEFKP